MELLTFKNLQKVLEDYGREVRNLYQDKLITHQHIASGELLNGVEYIVEGAHNEWTVSLRLQDYWKYIEDDTKPHFPPPDKLLQWVRIKPVIPRPGRDGRIPRPQQLAYLIGRKISEKGTKGTHDLSNAIKEINTKFEDKLVYALDKDCQQIFKILMIQGGLE